MNQLTYLTKVLRLVGWLNHREIRFVWVYQRLRYTPKQTATTLRPKV